MKELRVCSRGHQWEDERQDTICPVCVGTRSNPNGIPDTLQGPSETDQTIPLSEHPQPSIPGYEVLGELGRGGMGVVYKARHLRLNRLVALKMILAGPHADSHLLERFRTEAQVIASLQHPHIVQIFEVGEQGGLPFVALEYVGGGSLSQQLALSPLEPRGAAEMVETLALAVQHAHAQGIVHRDLKPANVLLAACSLAESAKPQAAVSKITDFGLAKRLEDVGSTTSGDIIGTPSYMAPEQAEGKTHLIGPACDIYALGAILYEALTGRPPFRGATVVETLRQVVHSDPLPPARLQPGVPRDLETICLKCLKKEPVKRYASCGALADDLRRFQEGLPIEARRASWLERVRKWVGRHPAAAALLGVCVLASAALTALGISYHHSLQIHNRDLTEAARNLAEKKSLAEQQRRRAEDNLEQAVEAIEQMLKRVGFLRLAGVPYMDNTRAELLEDALKFLERLIDFQSDDLRLRVNQAHTLERAGSIHMQLGRLDQARTRYQQSLTLLKALHPAADDPDTTNLLRRLEALVRNNLGLLAERKGDREGARKEQEAALKLREELLKIDPRNLDHRYDLGASYLNRALIARADKVPKEVVLYLNRALHLAKELTDEQPRESSYVVLLGMVLNDFGAYHLEAREADEAVPLLERAIESWRKLVAASPGDLGAQTELARSLSGLGVAWREQGYLKRSAAFTQESLDIRRRLAQQHPEVALFQLDYARSLMETGLLHRGRKELKEAIDYYTQSIAHLEGESSALLVYSRGREFLRESYLLRASARVNLDQHSEALKDLDRVLAIDKNTPAESLFDAARLLAVIARKDRDDRQAGRAVELLAKAEKADYFGDEKRRRWLEEHPDLTGLRGRADFDALRIKVGSR